MKNIPTISIITPSYNQGEFLEKTIQSILNQGYPNLEYIIMDGGSSDGSVEIIKRYASELTHWESKKDAGQSDAIHRGFKYCSGDLIGWVNSDDILLPNALNSFAKAYVDYDRPDFISGGSILINSEGNILKNIFKFPSIYGTKGKMTYEKITKRRFRFLQPGCLWSRTAYYDVGGINSEMNFCFDRDLFIRLTRKKDGIGIDILVAAYRIHENSKTSTLKEVQAKESKIIEERYDLGKSVFLKKNIDIIFSKLINMLSKGRSNINYLLGKYNQQIRSINNLK